MIQMRARFCKCDNAFCEWPGCERLLKVRARETTDGSGVVECSALCQATGYIREHIAQSEIVHSKVAQAKRECRRGGTRIYTDKDEQAIIDFVEKPAYELNRQREGVTCYNVAKAARDWAVEKHAKRFPQNAKDFKKAYENIKRRRRNSRR